MKCKIQFIVPSTGTAILQPAQEISIDRLTIGRATTQHVFLSDPAVALEHACLYQEDEKLIIESVAGFGVEVNGKPVTQSELKAGDSIAIGQYILTLFDPQSNHDLVIFIEPQVEETSAKPAAANKDQESRSIEPEKTVTQVHRQAMTLADTRLSKRRWSWLLVFFILALFLLAPLFGTFSDTSHVAAKLLPNDQIWNTGEFSHVHQHFAQQCDYCHQKLFVMVENQTCLKCHNDTKAHADLSATAGQHWRLAAKGRCGLCHKEHNGRLSLRPAHAELCTSCHRQMDQYADSEQSLVNVSDFGDSHPEFRPNVYSAGTWQRISLAADQVSHDSGLKFPHDVHLEEAGIESPDGQTVLVCGDCHEPEPGGAYILPIKMERHCLRCHQLNFDAAAPERVAPHGNIDELFVFLNEFYALQALKGGYKSSTAPPTIQRRRRPNDRVSGKQQQSALQWAQQKAVAVAKEMVEVRTCAVCHTVSAENNKVGWNFDSVVDPSRWMELAYFNHAKHNKQPCTDCHAATISSNAKEVLLPGIETCRQCHGGANANDKYATSCIVCHQFHIESKPAYGELQSDWAEQPMNWLQAAKEKMGL